MTRFGDNPIPSQQVPQQAYLITVPHVGMAPESAVNVYPGAFTVQTAGIVVAEFKVRLYWDGSDVWFRTNLNVSSPVPGYSSNFAYRTGLPAGYRMVKEVPILAVWYGVTPGQVISTGVNTYVGIGGAVLVAAGGIIRNSSS